jgi:hypothetical protein
LCIISFGIFTLAIGSESLLVGGMPFLFLGFQNFLPILHFYLFPGFLMHTARSTTKLFLFLMWLLD